MRNAVVCPSPPGPAPFHVDGLYAAVPCGAPGGFGFVLRFGAAKPQHKRHTLPPL